jgi:PilZ domain
MTGGHVDRRGLTRFRLRATVICRWKDEEGGAHEIDGLARDISMRGVYVVSSVPPPAGIQLGVEVLLPPLRPGLQQVQLQCDGEVVRVERGVPTSGFAVICDFGMIG